jgi:magnesium chelatase subunit I
VVAQALGVQGLRELANHVGLKANSPAPLVAAAVDFVLEGLYAQKKISRNDDRGYSAAETAPRRTPRREEPMVDENFQIPGGKKKYYN